MQYVNLSFSKILKRIYGKYVKDSAPGQSGQLHGLLDWLGAAIVMAVPIGMVMTKPRIGQSGGRSIPLEARKWASFRNSVVQIT